jgi:hypothetical protein
VTAPLILLSFLGGKAIRNSFMQGAPKENGRFLEHARKTCMKHAAAASFSSSLAPQSSRQEVGETSKALPLCGSSGQAPSSAIEMPRNAKAEVIAALR